MLLLEYVMLCFLDERSTLGEYFYYYLEGYAPFFEGPARASGRNLQHYFVDGLRL